MFESESFLSKLFDEDPFSNFGYGDSVAQHDVEYYRGQCFEADYYDTECSNVENDELLAHALQLSQLAVKEDLVSQNEGSQFTVSIFPEDWIGQPIEIYGSGQDYVEEEEVDTRPSSLCSTPDENPYIGDDWSCSLELSDEYALDGDVGKRLNQMVPIPHVPRINGEIPSVDEETLDHQRLLDRLQLYELVELKVRGDGNCQFRALSDQIYRTPEHHKFVREQVVNQLRSYPEIYEGYVPMAYVDYLEKISESGEWGDHVTLQAAADSYGVKIFVITSFKDTCYIEILPNIQRSNRVICLSFWAEVHYNSIYPEGDVPIFETKRKKRWWMRQNQHMENLNEYQ